MTTDAQPALPTVADLPDRVVVGANGAYWRDFGAFYSMCPVSDDNDPVEVVATYTRLPADAVIVTSASLAKALGATCEAHSSCPRDTSRHDRHAHDLLATLREGQR